MNELTCCGRLFGVASSERRRREVPPQLRVNYLIYPLRMRQIAQPYRTEVAQRDRLRKPAGHPIDDGLRENDLSAVGCSHDAGGTIYGTAKVIVVAPLDHTRVEPTAHTQRYAVGSGRIGKRLLQQQRGFDRV